MSTQHKLDRVRPPRVQITYDVEIGDAIEMKELPFVGGILADLSGKRDPEAALPPLRDRKFAQIDRDNFNEVMESINPTLAFAVENKLGEEGNLNVGLSLKEAKTLFDKERREFNAMDTFSPLAVVKQVPALNALFEERQRLADLIAKLDGNDKLDALLRDVVEDTAKLQEVKDAAGTATNGADEPSEDES